MITDPNNPYVRKPHRERLRSVRVPLPAVADCNLSAHPAEVYDSRVTVGPALARFIAEETGTVIADTERRYEQEYAMRIPPPRLFPYDERENPHGTVSKFDDAVKLDRAYMAHQRTKNKNYRRN